MKNNNRSLIELLRQQPQSESYSNRIRLVIAMLVQQGSMISLATTRAIKSIEVPRNDTVDLENHTMLDDYRSTPKDLNIGSTIFFNLSVLPYKLSDHFLSIQHFFDEDGHLYRLCSDSDFGSTNFVRYLTVDLLDASIFVISSSPLSEPRETKAQRRIRVVNDWMTDKKVELGLSAEASPQDVHDTLTENHQREKTQQYYWDEWQRIDPVLFPDGMDSRNFFNRDYRQIRFSRGIR